MPNLPLALDLNNVFLLGLLIFQPPHAFLNFSSPLPIFPFQQIKYHKIYPVI